MDRQQRKCRVHREYKVQYRAPIEVASGERVGVGHQDDEYPGWKWCKASNGREGWIPVELLLEEGAPATVLHDYSAQELAVEQDEDVEVEDERHDWLLVRNVRGQRGWIPASHVHFVK
jgi:uncharacterized protein YgiM (DUF1202 family)